MDEKAIEPVDQKQYAAFASREVPGRDDIHEGIWSVPMRMPDSYLTHSYCYLVRDEVGGIHVIDPGWPMADNESSLADTLVAIGSSLGDIRTITATHLHADHLGAADRLVRATGAELILHEAEQRALLERAEASTSRPRASESDAWGVPDASLERLGARSQHEDLPVPRPASRLVRHGDELPIPGRRIRVIHTPGHTAGHICLHDPVNEVLFTGDHLMPVTNCGLGLGGSSDTNPIADYLESLRCTWSIGDVEVAPGHEYRFHGLQERCDTSARHHVRRAREVLRRLESRPHQSVWEVAATLTWSAGWDNLRGFYLQSALAQTAMHMDLVRSPASRAFVESFDGFHDPV